MEKYYSKVVDYIIADKTVHRATLYISPKQIVRATRKHQSHHGVHIDMVVTIGRPNFVEREFIRRCKIAGEPFPVKKVQVKHYKPKKK
jgi:hypothetical protein